MAAAAGAGFFKKAGLSVSDQFKRAVVSGQHVCQTIHDQVLSISNNFARCAREFYRDISGEARLLGEGLVHISEADAQTQTEFRRDAANCAVETGLCVAEGVELEVSALIAAAEVGEKVCNSPAGSVDVAEAVTDFTTSLASSAVSAISAAAHMVVDLEKSGNAWEARHPRP